MKVIVLIENTSKCSLCAEHGLSVYIEYNGMKYLLDTGGFETPKGLILLNSCSHGGIRISLESIWQILTSHFCHTHIMTTPADSKLSLRKMKKHLFICRILLLKTVIIVQTILIDISEFLRIYWRLIKSVFNI